jgi:hypothetical protein
MRAAAITAGSIVALGLYLVVAAAFAFSPAAIGVGMLVIALVAAVAIVTGARTGATASAATSR